MTVNHLGKLSADYLELINDKEDFNVIINVGESPNIKTFNAHTNILRYRSLYFRNELASSSKNKHNIRTINLKKNVSIQQFEIIIKYIYGGVISIENHDESFIFNLTLVACEFFLNELVKQLETYLIESKTDWLYSHFVYIYQTSIQNKHLQELQKWCNDIMENYPNKPFESDDFVSFQEKELISLIMRDDLQMDEVKIWNCVIKWGIAKNQSLPIDPANWTCKDFITLQATLKNLLPHIRYFQMSGDGIIDSVHPYHRILDKYLWHDILKRAVNSNQQISSIILPPRVALKPKLSSHSKDPFSIVIDEAHAAEIASWIDKKIEPYSVTNNPYVFKLLVRGTRDGFTADSFWNLCNKQANTVVIMKVKDSDEIIGGYNPMEWVKFGTDDPNELNKLGGLWMECNDSFIFSLKNGTIQTSIVSCIKDPQYAIYCYSYNGPRFGYGSDLYMGNNFNQDYQCYCGQYSYEKAIRDIKGHFSVDEYEIFQVQKKVEY